MASRERLLVGVSTKKKKKTYLTYPHLKHETCIVYGGSAGVKRAFYELFEAKGGGALDLERLLGVCWGGCDGGEMVLSDPVGVNSVRAGFAEERRGRHGPVNGLAV